MPGPPTPAWSTTCVDTPLLSYHGLDDLTEAALEGTENGWESRQ